jgi:hypothetical protein
MCKADKYIIADNIKWVRVDDIIRFCNIQLKWHDQHNDVLLLLKDELSQSNPKGEVKR